MHPGAAPVAEFVEVVRVLSTELLPLDPSLTLTFEDIHGACCFSDFASSKLVKRLVLWTPSPAENRYLSPRACQHALNDGFILVAPNVRLQRRVHRHNGRQIYSHRVHGKSEGTSSMTTTTKEAALHLQYIPFGRVVAHLRESDGPRVSTIGERA